MKRLILAAFALIAASAAPAHSQPETIQGATANNARVIRPPTPESGIANFRITTESGKCLIPEIRDAGVYLIRTGGCGDAFTFNAKFYPGQRVRFEIDGSGTCLMYRRTELLPSGSVAIVLSRAWVNALVPAPCSEALEQRFRVDWSNGEGGTVVLRGMNRGCWQDFTSAVAEGSCQSGLAETRFRLGRADPAGYVPPAQGSNLPVARPVGTTMPTLTIITVPPPANAANSLPGPGSRPATFLVSAGSVRGDNDCFRQLGVTPRIVPEACRDIPETAVTLTYTGTRGYQLAMGTPPLCFTTMGKPWVTMVRCEPVAEQLFQVVPADFAGFHLIKTQAGLCLTQRGTPTSDWAQNNSALFPEPCREAPEQYFALKAVSR